MRKQDIAVVILALVICAATIAVRAARRVHRRDDNLQCRSIPAAVGGAVAVIAIVAIIMADRSEPGAYELAQLRLPHARADDSAARIWRPTARPGANVTAAALPGSDRTARIPCDPVVVRHRSRPRRRGGSGSGGGRRARARLDLELFAAAEGQHPGRRIVPAHEQRSAPDRAEERRPSTVIAPSSRRAAPVAAPGRRG